MNIKKRKEKDLPESYTDNMWQTWKKSPSLTPQWPFPTVSWFSERLGEDSDPRKKLDQNGVLNYKIFWKLCAQATNICQSGKYLTHLKMVSLKHNHFKAKAVYDVNSNIQYI